MIKKMLGVVTAVAAALLLVGVAWASGDRVSDDSSSSSSSSSVTSTPGSSLPGSTNVTNPSNDNGSSSSTSVNSSSTSSTIDNGSSTSTSVNGSSTSSTVDNSSTSTTIDDHGGTTNTSIDDNDNKDEVRAPAPANSDPTSYNVGGAGTVTVQIVTGQLVLLDVTATNGWSFEVDKSDGRDIRIEFESGESEAEFEAKLRDGQIRIEVEAKDS